MSLTRTRAWVAGTVVICLLLSVAAYFLLISPMQAEAADLDEQTASTQQSNAQLQSRLAELQAQFAELPQRQAELEAIKQAIPEDAALATLVRDLDATAAASGVTMMGLTPSAGVVVPTAAAAVAAPPADAATEGTDPAATTAAAVPSGDVLVSIPVTMEVVGGFFEAELFVKKVQTELARAFLVTDVALTAEAANAEASGGRPAVEPGDVTMTVTGSVFVLRSAADVAATAATAAAPAAPAPAPAPVSTTPSATPVAAP